MGTSVVLSVGLGVLAATTIGVSVGRVPARWVAY